MASPPPARTGHKPWGRVVALAAACAVTLLGVSRGLDPDVILLRALGAALVLGPLAMVVQVLVYRFLRPS